MDVRKYLRKFETSIYNVVDTYEWSDIENKMDQDETFTALLMSYVEALLAEESAWSVRFRISKTTHPVKKERLLAEAVARESHLVAIQTRVRIGDELNVVFLGEVFKQRMSAVRS